MHSRACEKSGSINKSRLDGGIIAEAPNDRGWHATSRIEHEHFVDPRAKLFVTQVFLRGFHDLVPPAHDHCLQTIASVLSFFAPFPAPSLPPSNHTAGNRI